MKNRIYAVLGDFCHLSSTDPTQRLTEDLGLDASDLSLLLLSLQNELGVFFASVDADPSRYRTVADLFALSLRYLTEATEYLSR